MTYAIEVLKEKLTEQITYSQRVKGVIIDEDCSDSDRDFMRSVWPEAQQKVKDLEKALEVLGREIPKSTV